jgi:hypothetical protein
MDTLTTERDDLIAEAIADRYTRTNDDVRSYGDETADVTDQEIKDFYREVRSGLRCEVCGQRDTTYGGVCESCKIDRGDI